VCLHSPGLTGRRDQLPTGCSDVVGSMSVFTDAI
jgi:hypothetical protein